MDQTSTEPLKKTPLNARHRALGARMVPFGGWDLPVEYSGIVNEHLTVRSKAGLFDVSHMGEIELAGKKLKCHWVKVKRQVESRIEALKDRSSAKTWYSDEIPGRVAKIEMTRWINEDPPHDFVVIRVVKGWKRE